VALLGSCSTRPLREQVFASAALTAAATQKADQKSTVLYRKALYFYDMGQRSCLTREFGSCKAYLQKAIQNAEKAEEQACLANQKILMPE